MRAGRLVSLLLILQRRGRVTAAELARELEVSQRTVLRDIEELSGAGVPVYATRGPGGGFELLEGHRTDLPVPPGEWRADRRPGRPRRARVRITAEGRRLAALLGRLQPLRVSRTEGPDELGRLEATFRIHTLEGTVLDVLSLGPHIEVVGPTALRTAVADRLTAAAHLYASDGSVGPPPTEEHPP